MPSDCAVIPSGPCSPGQPHSPGCSAQYSSSDSPSTHARQRGVIARQHIGRQMPELSGGGGGAPGGPPTMHSSPEAHGLAKSAGHVGQYSPRLAGAKHALVADVKVRRQYGACGWARRHSASDVHALTRSGGDGGVSKDGAGWGGAAGQKMPTTAIIHAPRLQMATVVFMQLPVVLQQCSS